MNSVINGKPVGPGKVVGVTMAMSTAAAVVLFVAAGTMQWIGAWLYLSLTTAFGLGMRLVLLRRSPDLLQERAEAMKKGDSAPWDRVLMPLSALAGPTLVLLTAGLDRRCGWSRPLSADWTAAAAAVVAAGCWIGAAAAGVNRFFSAVVRIQADRGHRVVDSGPYGRVRHPGYAGALAVTLATPVLLGALWAFVPAVLVTGLVVLRTALEDRKLQQELDGYAAYARRVKYRLVPGVW